MARWPRVRTVLWDPNEGCSFFGDDDCDPFEDEDSLKPGYSPAYVYLFEWGRLRPEPDEEIELLEKPYLNLPSPSSGGAKTLDSIFLYRATLPIASGAGTLADCGDWPTARGDVLLTRLRPDTFTRPGYTPPDGSQTTSPPISFQASDMHPWDEHIMEDSMPVFSEPLDVTYDVPLGDNVENDSANQFIARLLMNPLNEPRRAPYTIIGQAFDVPLVIGKVHTVHADICVWDGETCLAKPAGTDIPTYLISRPEEVVMGQQEHWIDLSTTWFEPLTIDELGSLEEPEGKNIPHPKGLLSSVPGGDSLEQLRNRMTWVLTEPVNRPDLLDIQVPDVKNWPFERVVPHARLKVTEPGVYEVEFMIQGETGENLLVDKVWISTVDINLTAYWPSPSKQSSHPGPVVREEDEDNPLNLFLAVNDDDDDFDHIMDNAVQGFPLINIEDDELVTFTIDQFDPLIGTLTLSADAELRLFTADGMQEVSLPMTIDFANPPVPSMIDQFPLAQVMDGDVTLLAEASSVSGDAVIELRYTRDGQELARDEVHLTVVNPEVQGGFTRGDIDTDAPQSNVQYRAMLPLGGKDTGAGKTPNRQWLWGELRENNHPYSIVVPIPENVRTAANQYRQDGKATGLFLIYKEKEATTWTFGEPLTATVFTPLAETYNTISNELLNIPDIFNADELKTELQTAMGFPQESTPEDFTPVASNDARYFLINGLTEPGLYEARFYMMTTDTQEQLLFGSTEFVMVRADLNIHHGNTNRDEVVVDKEEIRGALTVVNRNDTDADGQLDHQDSDGVMKVSSQTGIVFQDEVDLIQLDLQQSVPDYLATLQEFGDTLTVKVVTGNDLIVFWEEPTKETLISPNSSGIYEFPVNALTTMWGEVMAPSASVGDISIQLTYTVEDTESTDIVKATGIWPEIDVREASRHENRVGRDDPRMTDDDALTRNRLLVWHDSGNDNAITFEVVKTDVPDGGTILDNNSPIWVQIEEKENLNGLNTMNNGQHPFCECLEIDLQKYPDPQHPKLKPPLEIRSNPIVQAEVPTMSDDKKDYFVPDFVVTYGIDYDESGTLVNDEIKGKYEIFGITQFDYQEAINRYDTVYLPLTLSDLGQALCYRVSHGVWEEPTLPGLYGDYRPNKDGACIPAQEAAIRGKSGSCSAPGFDTDLSLTHNLGARFTNHTSASADVKNADGTGGNYPRRYLDAMMTVPIYYWDSDSDASKLMRNSNFLRNWILYEFLFNKTFADINNNYGAGTGVKQLTFPFPQDGSINFTPFKTIGLGWATLNPIRHGKQPEITLSVEKIDADTYDILPEATLRAFSVDDGFDYNYFKLGTLGIAKKTVASVSGSSMQSSFGQEGALPSRGVSPAPGDVFRTTGQVPREHIDIDGEHNLVPVDADLGSVAGFRIRKTGGPWSLNNWSVFVMCGEENEKKCEKYRTWFDEKFDNIMVWERTYL